MFVYYGMYDTICLFMMSVNMKKVKNKMQIFKSTDENMKTAKLKFEISRFECSKDEHIKIRM